VETTAGGIIRAHAVKAIISTNYHLKCRMPAFGNFQVVCGASNIVV